MKNVGTEGGSTPPPYKICGVGLIVGRGCMCTDEMWVQLPHTSPKFFKKFQKNY